MQRTFKDILSELGSALDKAFSQVSLPVEVTTPPITIPPIVTPPVVTPPVVVAPPVTGNGLFTKEPTKTSVMKQIVELGVTANGGQYRVIIFDDDKMRVYQNVKDGWKQVSEESKDTPKSGMSAYFTHGFMKEHMDKVLWNLIQAKLFPEEVK